PRCGASTSHTPGDPGIHRKAFIEMTEPAPQPASQPAAPLTEAEDKQWASFAHFGGVLFILPPLIIWLVFKDRGPRTNVEGKESVNFQITIAIAWVALVILTIILSLITFGL